MSNAFFRNEASVDINMHLDWSSGGTKNTTIKPGETAEIQMDDQEAIICHRSDGVVDGTCPTGSRTARGGEKFVLLENGAFGDWQGSSPLSVSATQTRTVPTAFASFASSKAQPRSIWIEAAIIDDGDHVLLHPVSSAGDAF